MSKQNTPTQKSGSTGFSFGKILTPKLRQMINFDSQPSQTGSPADPKKSGLEAYAKKNKLSLPPDFSDLVLECEMELERDEVSIEAVTKLTDLYSQAMAFYEAEGSHKYKYFAKKLQDLMLRPNVKETMVREIAPVKNNEEDKELKRMRLESQVSKVNTEKEAFTLVKTHEYKEKEIKKVLEGDLTNQRDRIQKRLAERKAKSQSRAQSVNYISDEASSTTEEVQQDIDNASPKAQQKLIKIEEADEADESRYGTPPRRRNRDGQMIIYFPKGKKSLKKLFLEELKSSAEETQKVVRTHVRRYSENKAPVLSVVTPVTGAATKRVGRAQSFSARGPLVHSGLLRKASNNSLENKDVEESKTDSHEQEPRSLSGVGKDEQVENPSVVEHDKPKSNNTVEETDEEGSKNGSGSKNSVGQEEEETVVEKAEANKEEVAQEESKNEIVQEKAETQVEVAAVTVQEEVTEEKEIVREAETEVNEEVVAVAAVQEEKAVEEEVTVAVAQEEKAVEEEVTAVVVEQQENTIDAPVVETEVEVEVKQQEEKAEKEQITEDVVEQQEEPAQGNNEVQETEVVSNIQEQQAETTNQPEVTELTTEEKTQEVEQEEETNNTQEPQVEEQKTETENIDTVEVKEEKVEETPVEKEESPAARRRRTDSEIADEEKLKMLRKIDEEHKVLLEEFVSKQAEAREAATKQVEEKFAKKLQAMEEDMDDDEKLSMMWQKAVAKINKDKENEVQKVVEELSATQTQETEKYKKKLQQQKMFKLAQMSS